MPEFKPGWYQVGVADSEGNRSLLYFKTYNLVTAECYITADGRRIWLNDRQRSTPWQASYTLIPSDPQGHWDNKATADSKSKAGGQGSSAGQSKNGSAKTPCEDASLKCEICDQKGLPILPLRYAVARNDVKSKAPSLGERFGDGVSSISLPEDHAKYTLRAVRPGYLYVFNEKRGQWRGYVVADDGYLLEYDINVGPPDIGRAKPCARMAKAISSRCVIIPDAEKAGRVWLGFSDTAWTSAVLDNNRKESYRKRHMRSVDVGAWVAGSREQPHVDVMDKLVLRVGEFAMPLPSRNWLRPLIVPPQLDLGFSYKLPMYLPQFEHEPAFNHSMHLFSNCAATAHDLMDSAEKAVEGLSNQPPALMVAINDPVGVTSELSSLMSVLMKEFLSQPSIKWPMVTATTLGSLENIVKNQAITGLISKKKDTGSFVAGTPNPAAGLARIFGGDEHRKVQDASMELISNATKEETEKAATDKWNSYLDKLQGGHSAPSYKSPNSSLKASIEKFDSIVLAPLAEAHRAWIKSSLLAACLECNHDSRDVRSGQGYMDAVVLCVQDSQDKKICFDVYADWMSAKKIEADNIVLKALLFNQDVLIDQINAAMAAGTDWSFLESLPWDSMIGAYDTTMERLQTGGQGALARLLTGLGGGLMWVVDKALDKGVGPALIAIGVVAGTPVVRTRWQGYKADAIKDLILRMQAVNADVGRLDRFALQAAIDLEMRRSRIYGNPMGRGNFDYLLFADKRVVEDFPGNTSGARSPEKKFAELAILSEEEVQSKTRLRWKELATSNVRLGMLTGILQVVALGKMADDVDKSMIHERGENQWRFRAGVSALIGTTGEVLDSWIRNAAALGNRSARAVPAYFNKILGKGGAGLGFIAGGAMAFWDMRRGFQEYQEGNTNLAVLYWISAGASVGAMIALSSWGAIIFGSIATGIGIFLVMLIIFIAFYIEYKKDSKIQDWMERCYYGKFELKARYSSFEQQMDELQIALRG